jgi:hypothetical protein
MDLQSVSNTLKDIGSATIGFVAVVAAMILIVLVGILAFGVRFSRPFFRKILQKINNPA